MWKWLKRPIASSRKLSDTKQGTPAPGHFYKETYSFVTPMTAGDLTAVLRAKYDATEGDSAWYGDYLVVECVSGGEKVGWARVYTDADARLKYVRFGTRSSSNAGRAAADWVIVKTFVFDELLPRLHSSEVELSSDLD